jgi:hypothetical protein
MRLKIYFSDFWHGFDIHDNIFINLLKDNFDVTVDKNPDILFFLATVLII